MIKQREDITHKPEIDLTGPDGNAFCLIAIARRLSKQLSLDADKIVKEMQSGDYEHLIEVFDKYFGEYIDLVK